MSCSQFSLYLKNKSGRRDQGAEDATEANCTMDRGSGGLGGALGAAEGGGPHADGTGAHVAHTAGASSVPHGMHAGEESSDS